MKPLTEIMADPRVRVASQGDDGFAGTVDLCGARFALIVSNGLGWDHASMSHRKRCPLWMEMAALKDLVFLDDEEAFQFHPAKGEYVNLHPNCLHLWRPNDGQEILTPPIGMV